MCDTEKKKNDKRLLQINNFLCAERDGTLKVCDMVDL